MCSDCSSIFPIIGVLAIGLIFAFAACFVVILQKKYDVNCKSVRMYYLESSLKHQCVVQDPNELECLTEYIELLVKLGFKSKEINRMVLSCCFIQDFG